MPTLPDHLSRNWEDHRSELKKCRICPHECGADRLSGQTGKCGSDAGFNISTICLHKGEEPVISGIHGICNVFFSRCNLSCIYCQNWQISRNKGNVRETRMELSEVISSIIAHLELGCTSVGFVSPSHYIPHVKMIIETLREIGHHPVFVYNSNGFDKVEELRTLESYIDVYLPDFKYADDQLAFSLSGIRNYPEVAMAALKEMYRQKGSTLILDEQGMIETGMIIRHLILPGQVENSKEVLRRIADQLSASIAISLMAQYWPIPDVEHLPDLGRTLHQDEYDQVVNELDSLGFYKGWTQELESQSHYRPDFEDDQAFR